MSIGKKTNLTDAPIEPSRRKINLSRAMLASLCLVILPTGISLLFIIRSSHQFGTEQNFAKEAAAASTESSAAPTSGAPTAGPSYSREAKGHGSAAANPRIVGKKGEKATAEITARGKRPTLGVDKSEPSDAGLR